GRAPRARRRPRTGALPRDPGPAPLARALGQVLDQPDRARRVRAADALAERVARERDDVRPGHVERDAPSAAAGPDRQRQAESAAPDPARPADRRPAGGRRRRRDADEDTLEAAAEVVD